MNKKQADELVLRCTDNNSSQVAKPGHVINLWQWFIDKDYDHCRQIVDLALKQTPYIPTIYDLEKARSSLTMEGMPAASAYRQHNDDPSKAIDDGYAVWRQDRLLEMTDEAYLQYMQDRRSGNHYMEARWQEEWRRRERA